MISIPMMKGLMSTELWKLGEKRSFESKFRIVVPISETRPYKPDEPFKSSLVRTIIGDIR